MEKTKETKRMFLISMLYLMSVYGVVLLDLFLINIFPGLPKFVAFGIFGLPLVIGVLGFLYYRKHTENISRTALLTGAVLIKYLLIPLYLFGGLVCLVALLLIFTPLVFMIFAGPMTILFMFVLGVLYLLGGSLFSFAYIMKAHSEKIHGTALTVICTVCQFFFVTDVIAIAVLTLKEKKNIVATIAMFSAIVLGIVALVVSVVVKFLT